MTADELFPSLPPVRGALCIRCHRNTTAPIPVRWIESNSGPGTTLYACPDCAPTLGAGPTPEDTRGPTTGEAIRSTRSDRGSP